MKLEELRALERAAKKGSAWERDSALVRIAPLLLDLWEAAEKLRDSIDDDGIGTYISGCSEAHLFKMNEALAALEAAK